MFRWLRSLVGLQSNATAALPVAFDYKFPPGVRYTNTPIVIEGQVGMTLSGTRSFGIPSRWIYRGPPCPAPIQFIGCTRCKLLDVELIDESGCDATVLVTNAVNPPMQGWSTANEFRNVRILLSSNGKASKYGFNIDSYALGGMDGNNDHHQFHSCYVQSYRQAAWRISGSQCHDLYFFACAAHDAAVRPERMIGQIEKRPIGFDVVEGVFLCLHRCAFNSNSIDVKLGTAESQFVADGINSENSQQFLVYMNPSGMLTANVKNVQWRGKPALLRPVIDVSSVGSWNLSSIHLAGLEGIYPIIRIQGNDGSADLSGITIRQHGGITPVSPFVTVSPNIDLRWHGLRYNQIRLDGTRVNKRVVPNQTLGVV